MTGDMIFYTNIVSHVIQASWLSQSISTALTY